MFKQSPLLFRYLVCLALLLISGSVMAQGSLFTPSEIPVEELNEQQLDTYRRVAQSGVYADLQLIDIAPLSEVMGSRLIYLGYADQDLYLEIKTIEYIDDGDYYLYAVRQPTERRLDPGPATLMLRAGDGLTYGTFQFGGNFYRIDDLGRGQNILMRELPSEDGKEAFLNDALTGDGESHQHDFDPFEEDGAPRPTTGSRNNCDVRVLFLFTSSAAGRLANINTTAQSHIDQANQSLGNSAVSSSQLRFELAGAEILTTVDETSQSMSSVLSDVRGDATAQARRNATNADLVCLMADDQIGSFGTTAGIAYIGSNGAPASNSFAYSVIEVFASLVNKLFAHEGGHNMGCNHEPAVTTSTAANKAHEWTWSTGWWLWKRNYRAQTIMWSSANQSESVLHYSNPNVNYSSGNATGTTGANNAATLRSNACTVALYRNANANLTVNINGPLTACPLETVCWSANVSGTPGPYTYQWAYALVGSSYTNFSTSSFACLSMTNFTPPAVINIRVTVSAPGQPDRTAFTSVFMSDNGGGSFPCQQQKSPEIPVHNGPIYANSLEVFPNPADFRSQVRLDLVQDGPVEMAIFDVTGQKVRDVAAGTYEAGSHIFEMETSQLPAGVYLIRAECSGQRLLKRMVVNH